MSVEDGKEIIPADPSEGFDRDEPSAGAIATFAIGSLILLVMTILAIQQYFDHIWSEAVYEKVLAPPSEQLKEVRGRDDWNLTHYMFMDKPSGQVRIPVDRAMELNLQDAAAGKTFYPAKEYVPKKEEPAVAAAPAAGAPGTTPATPPAATPEKK
ncbi:MAG TPA: hypothetical protein VK752_04085 [Bryobacteraceae bacterium]|jgi:hypothetical protein|nr:hypothetical protein [Bryobacteraceae bacterium]